jgi:hypothetical protein
MLNLFVFPCTLHLPPSEWIRMFMKEVKVDFTSFYPNILPYHIVPSHWIKSCSMFPTPYFHCNTYIGHVPFPLYKTIFHTPWTLIPTSLSFWRWSLQCTLKHRTRITHNTAEPQKPTLHIRCHKYLTIRIFVIFAILSFNCTQKIL